MEFWKKIQILKNLTPILKYWLKNCYSNWYYQFLGPYEPPFYNFIIEIANIIFWLILNESKIFFNDRANQTRFSESRSLSDQKCMLTNF